MFKCCALWCRLVVALKNAVILYSNVAYKYSCETTLEDVTFFNNDFDRLREGGFCLKIRGRIYRSF